MRPERCDSYNFDSDLSESVKISTTPSGLFTALAVTTSCVHLDGKRKYSKQDGLDHIVSRLAFRADSHTLSRVRLDCQGEVDFAMRKGRLDYIVKQLAYRINSHNLSRVCLDCQWEVGLAPQMAPKGVLGPEGGMPCCPQPRKRPKQKLVGQLQQLAGW